MRKANEGEKPKNSKRKFKKAPKPDDGSADSASDTDDQIQKHQRKGEPKFPNVQGSVNHTFLATPSARKVKAAWREINAIVPQIPQYLKYADMAITWDHTDHPQ